MQSARQLSLLMLRGFSSVSFQESVEQLQIKERENISNKQKPSSVPICEGSF